MYSPRDPKMGPKLALPLKRGLDPKKYGGFSSQQFAYFFVYEARDKKGKRVFRFAEVPVWLASQIESDKTALERYASELADAEKLKFVRIERAKILKKQLIEIDGDRLIVTGVEEVRNGRQLYLSQQEQGVFLDLLGFEAAVNEGDLDCLLREMINRGSRIAEGLLSKMKLEDRRGDIEAATFEEKRELLIQLARIINASNRQIDLSAFGGARTAGQYKVNYSKELSDPNVSFAIIDQSVTGMFERRIRIGL